MEIVAQANAVAHRMMSPFYIRRKSNAIVNEENRLKKAAEDANEKRQLASEMKKRPTPMWAQNSNIQSKSFSKMNRNPFSLQGLARKTISITKCKPKPIVGSNTPIKSTITPIKGSSTTPINMRRGMFNPRYRRNPTSQLTILKL